MGLHLRDKKTQAEMDKLTELLNPDDFELAETERLMSDLKNRFGSNDMFIKRAENLYQTLHRKHATSK